jgi:hypothetical protein
MKGRSQSEGAKKGRAYTVFSSFLLVNGILFQLAGSAGSAGSAEDATSPTTPGQGALCAQRVHPGNETPGKTPAICLG